MGSTADLVARSVNLELGDVPPAAVDAAKAALLDTLAVALAAQGERVVQAARGFVVDEASAGACTVWGGTHRASPARAALANGTASHALDFDDVCWAMNAHPSAVLWPAAIAVAEATGASGATALLGYVAGFEAAADIGGWLGQAHYAAGWHPTATIGTLAATVAAAKILGLGEVLVRRAIGIACSEAAGSRMSFGTDTKPLHAGFAAEAGVTAALLAARGVTSREDGIEATMGLVELYAGTPTARTRTGFALLDPGIEVKPYPSCRFTHRVIDAVLAIRGRRGSRALRSLECTIDPFAEQIVIHPRPTNGLEAKFSMQYCAAVAWIDGWPGLAAFSDERAAGGDVQHLLANVTVRHGSADAETVTVTFEDGGTDVETVRVARGSPARPLGPEDVLAKVRACTGFDAERAAALARATGTIDVQADLRELLSLVTG
jgi:2-methylcitrate dehydratase PrpD